MRSRSGIVFSFQQSEPCAKGGDRRGSDRSNLGAWRVDDFASDTAVHDKAEQGVITLANFGSLPK
ncbi:hypothetical protein AB4874_13815 [Thioclava sp. 15-R06ZXC-3]|uniref:Uncharacterized protein n=1 Tax=Thioclava arctica TaxID=3238301 RepID=A0ABV3TMA5_9RHOB